jgi:hypothetical protein
MAAGGVRPAEGRAMRWWIDEEGRVRDDAQGRRPPEGAAAAGWVEPESGLGGVERVSDGPACLDRVGTATLDRLEARYPGVRWFVPVKRAA